MRATSETAGPATASAATATATATASAADNAPGNPSGVGADMTICTTDQHGRNPLRVRIAATPAAEAAAVAFLRRTTGYVVGQQHYRVVGQVEAADERPIGGELMEFLCPTCEHGLSLTLCMGPDHWPTYEQERALWG